jgi:glyoxylase-like metal-dependent hydrolase (beta-lactamase superfamily II)
MRTIQFQLGNLGANCFLLYCEKSLEAAVIDPGGDPFEVLTVIAREKLTVKYIINTHGHADHIAGNQKLKQATGGAILIHAADAEMLTNARHNLSMYIGNSIQFEPADLLLKDGDVISFGSVELKVIHTPGHTPGGICLLANGVLFSGDTLFYESIGRTDFPGGSSSALIQSIKEKLLGMPDTTKVLPGHGPDTSIGWERKMNPFIQ